MSNVIFQNTDNMSNLPSISPPAPPPAWEIWGRTSAKTAKESIKSVAISADLEANRQIMSVLYKAPSSFLEKDKDLAIEAIGKYYGAYLITGSLQNDIKFNERAVNENSAAYNLMSAERQRDPNLATIYISKMMRESTSQVIDGHTVMVPRHQIAQHLPIDMQEYEKSYLAVLKKAASGKYTERDIMESPERRYMGIIQTLAKNNPELQDAIEKTERAVIERNYPNIIKLMREKSPLEPGMEAIYTEAGRLVPTMQKTMDEAKRARCLDPVQIKEYSNKCSYLDYCNKRPHRMRTKEEFEMYDAAERAVKETQKIVKDREMREASLAYLKQSSIDYIYSLATDGLISMDDAAICVGMISSIPTLSKANATHSGLIYATVNDFDNVDYQTPEEAMATRAAQIKEKIIDTDAKLDAFENEIYAAKNQAQDRSWAYAPDGYDEERVQTISYTNNKKN